MTGLISLILAIPMIILRGFVLSSIWLWYLVPGLNVEPISVFTGIGFAFIINLLTMHLTLGQVSILMYMGITTPSTGVSFTVMGLNFAGILMIWFAAYLFYIIPG